MVEAPGAESGREGGWVQEAAARPGSLIGPAIRALRPKQWVKNVFVFAPLLFAGHLFDGALVLRALGAFGLFTAIAGAAYVFNDLFDIQKDRLHPFKRLRPIASGALPLPSARVLAALLGVGGVLASFTLGWPFALCALAYFALNLGYTLLLKHYPFVDVICIAAGFLLRVMAGSFAVDVPMSRWLLICTFLLALFLALGKRKHEYVTLHLNGNGNARKVMERYRLSHLTRALWVVGAATVVSYALYTVSPETTAKFGTPYLSATLPFIAFGIWRFGKLVSLDDAESPTEEMLRDFPFVVNALLWVAAVTAVIYLSG
jgi:4-hydroxybenzoate polyprenyltransferase